MKVDHSARMPRAMPDTRYTFSVSIGAGSSPTRCAIGASSNRRGDPKAAAVAWESLTLKLKYTEGGSASTVNFISGCSLAGGDHERVSELQLRVQEPLQAASTEAAFRGESVGREQMVRCHPRKLAERSEPGG